MHIIKKEEIETIRTPTEIYKWVFTTLDKFVSKEEVNLLRGMPYNGIIKTFVEESYPLAIFCNNYFSEDSSVKIHHTVGDKSPDVQVKNCNDFNYIEITYAKDGQDEILRFEKLNDTLSVPKFGSIDKKYNKNSTKRTISLNGVALSHNEIIEECKKLIKQVVAKKVKKQKNNRYPDKTMLIVAFDDISFKSKEDISNIKLFMINELNPTIGKFSGLALVGMSGKLCI